MRKRDKLYFKNRHQPSPEKKPHKLKSLKHLIQSMRRKYWDYVEDLITPKDEHSLEEKFSISKFFLYIYQT